MSKILRRCLSLALVFMLLASLSVSGALNASAEEKTGDGLAAYAMTAYNEGWSYVWGGASYGAVDCSGLIYSYVGGGARVTEDMLYSSPESGNVSDGVPDIPGLGLWQPGHVGVYVGGGMAVDARDEISNVCYQSVSTKSWVMWFKVAGVSYSADAGVANEDQSEKNADPEPAETKTPEKPEPLSLGSTGAEVNKLQERLKELGYFDDNTTEYFGYVTKGALESFQSEAGLSATGVYDEETEAALNAADAPSKPTLTSAQPDDEEQDTTDSVTSDEDETLTAIVTEAQIEEQTGTDEESQNADESFDAEQSVPEEDDTYEKQVFAQFDEYDEEEQSSASGSENDDDSTASVKPVPGITDDFAVVCDIQYILIKLGYYDYDINGIYSDNTAEAVNSFKCDYELSDDSVLDEETIGALYDAYGELIDGASISKQPLNESIAADGAAGEEASDETAPDTESETETKTETETGREQSVTVTLTTDSETGESTVQPIQADADTAKAQSDSDKETKTSVAAQTASTAAQQSNVTYAGSPKTSDNSVVFVQTGVEDYFTATTAVILIIASLAVIFFAGTIHYWNVSMEKRRQRARRATTVSVYRKGSF